MFYLHHVVLTKDIDFEQPCDNSILFRMIDENSNELIGEYGRMYELENISICQQDFQSAIKAKVDGGGKISFVLTEDTSDEPLNNVISKTFLLNFQNPKDTSEIDTDTILFEYVLTQQECPPIWFEDFKVSYNDSLYHDGEFDNTFRFIKK